MNFKKETKEVAADFLMRMSFGFLFLYFTFFSLETIAPGFVSSAVNINFFLLFFAVLVGFLSFFEGAEVFRKEKLSFLVNVFSVCILLVSFFLLFIVLFKVSILETAFYFLLLAMLVLFLKSYWRK